MFQPFEDEKTQKAVAEASELLRAMHEAKGWHPYPDAVRLQAAVGQLQEVRLLEPAGRLHGRDDFDFRSAPGFTASTPIAFSADGDEDAPSRSARASLMERFPRGTKIRVVKPSTVTRASPSLKVGDETEVVGIEDGLLLLSVPGFLMVVHIEPENVEIIGAPPAKDAERSGMVPVDLLTAQGEEVVRVRIPPFLRGTEPKVIVWGQRFFVRTPAGEYREAFTYVVPPESSGA